MSTQACNLSSLYVANYLTASRFVTVGQDKFCSALVIPKYLRLFHLGYFTAETTVYHPHSFWAVSTPIFVGAFMTLADIIVFSGIIRHLFLIKMEKNQGQLPGIVAYLV